MVRSVLPTAVCFAAVVSSAHAGVLATESFSSDGSVADYSGAGKFFSAYAAAGDAATSVSGGKLNLQMTASTTGTDTLYTHVDFGPAKSLVSMQFDLQGVQYSAASGAFQLYFGSFNTITDFEPGWNPSGNGRNWARVVLGSSATAGTYTVAAHGPAGSVASTSGSTNQTYTWTVFLNDSGSTQTYVGPDFASYSLNDDSWSIFIGSTLLAGNIAKGTTGDSADLQGAIFMVSRNYDGGKSSTNLDNLLVRDDLGIVPEPTAMGLLGFGALLSLRRRRDC